MEKKILLKEEEFYKLNAELQLKTQELLKEVEDVLKLQDRTSNSTNADTPCHNQNESSSSSEERDILPDTSLGMGSEGMVRFLKAKLKGLQSEIQTLQSDYKKQTVEWHMMQTEMKHIEEDRNRWQHQAMTFRDTMRKLEQQNSTTAAKLSQQEMENSKLQKELDNLKRELRSATQTSSGNEVRLNRSLEELEKLRTVLQRYKCDDKELLYLARRKGEEAATVIRRLEKQKMELLHGFKKQMQLIDNLKKQKTHLKAASLLQFTEAEFMKLLDWCPTTFNSLVNPDHGKT